MNTNIRLVCSFGALRHGQIVVNSAKVVKRGLSGDDFCQKMWYRMADPLTMPIFVYLKNAPAYE